MESFGIFFLGILILSGLNKADLYHFLYLFIFVAYLNMPKRTKGITKIAMYYSFLSLVVKYLYTFYID